MDGESKRTISARRLEWWQRRQRRLGRRRRPAGARPCLEPPLDAGEAGDAEPRPCLEIAPDAATD